MYDLSCDLTTPHTMPLKLLNSNMLQVAELGDEGKQKSIFYLNKFKSIMQTEKPGRRIIFFTPGFLSKVNQLLNLPPLYYLRWFVLLVAYNHGYPRLL